MGAAKETRTIKMGSGSQFRTFPRLLDPPRDFCLPPLNPVSSGRRRPFLRPPPPLSSRNWRGGGCHCATVKAGDLDFDGPGKRQQPLLPKQISHHNGNMTKRESGSAAFVARWWDSRAMANCCSQQHPNSCMVVLYLARSHQAVLNTHYQVMTTALCTQGPFLPSLSAGHRYVRMASEVGSERWKRTCRSGWKERPSYSIVYCGVWKKK